MQNDFMKLEEIANDMANLCPYDDHNELIALNAIRVKLQQKINRAFSA